MVKITNSLILSSSTEDHTGSREPPAKNHCSAACLKPGRRTAEVETWSQSSTETPENLSRSDERLTLSLPAATSTFQTLKKVSWREAICEVLNGRPTRGHTTLF